MAIQTPPTLAVATPATYSVPALPPGSKHGFFKSLPRELRDNIYDLLYEEIEASYVEMYRLRMTCPDLNLRLVNRQFELEYSERSSTAEHMNQLQLTDMLSDALWWRFLHPIQATRVTNLVVEREGCRGGHCSGQKPCHGVKYLLPCHQNWLNLLTCRLPRLRRIRVALIMGNDMCAYVALEDLTRITIQPEVTEVKLLRNYDLTENPSDRLLATWTRQHGLDESGEAILTRLELARFPE